MVLKDMGSGGSIILFISEMVFLFSLFGVLVVVVFGFCVFLFFFEVVELNVGG